jgi:hypothetical protein
MVMIYMTQEQKNEHGLSDIILEACPLGCNRECSELWINEIIGHRIVCKCIECDHDKKEQALEVVGSPRSNANCNRHLFSGVNSVRSSQNDS